MLDDRTVRAEKLDPHLVGEDLGERRLAEAGGAAEKEVVERLAATARRLDEDAEVLLVLRLADVVVERLRAQGAVEAVVVPLGGAVRGGGQGLRGWWRTASCATEVRLPLTGKCSPSCPLPEEVGGC